MRRRIAVVLAVAVVSLIGTGLFAFFSQGSVAKAQGPTIASDGQPTRFVTVVGHGSVRARPDVAVVNLGVEAKAADVPSAVSQSSDTMDGIRAALVEAGVAEEDVQTSEYSIFFDESFSGPDVPAEPSYRVLNMVSVTIRDLATVGDVIAAAVGAGANRFYGISFALSDTSGLEVGAREKAIADARQRAEHLATLVGASVGDVISVSEVVTGGLQPPAVAAVAGGRGGGPTISPGQLEFSTDIQVSYELNLSQAASGEATTEAGPTESAGTAEATAAVEATAEATVAAEPTIAIPESATPVAAGLVTPGGATSYTVRLYANPLPSETAGNLFLVGWVRVLPLGSDTPTQTLTVEFHARERGLAGTKLIGEDINFDGYWDLAVVEPGGAKWQVSHWYLFDPESGTFVTNTLTEQLGLLPWVTYTLDAQTQEIHLQNIAGQTPVETVYALENGELVLVSADPDAPTLENNPFSPPPG